MKKSSVIGYPQTTIMINYERVIVTSQRYKTMEIWTGIVLLQQWIDEWKQSKTN